MAKSVEVSGKTIEQALQKALKELKAAAEDYAARDGVSLNQFIALALAEKVGAFGASEFFSERAVGADPARGLEFLRTAPDVPPDLGDEIHND